MKKILFSLSAMIVLLQFSCVAEASQDKYILQDTPVTFMEKTETQTVEDTKPTEETTIETNVSPQQEQQEIKNVNQEVQTPQEYNEQPAVQQEQKQEVEQVEKTEQVEEINENEQFKEEPTQIEQKEEKGQNIEQKSSDDENVVEEEQQATPQKPVQPSVSEQFTEILEKSLNNAELIVNSSDMLATNGLLLMQKAVYQNSSDMAEYEKKINETVKIENFEEKMKILYELKKEIITSIDEKLKVTEFDTLTQEEKYQWGKGSYVVKVAQNRCDNVSNDLSPLFKIILNGKIEQKNCTPQLKKAEILTKKIENDRALNKKLISIADKINAENQISLKIPEKEAVVVNQNSTFYELDKQVKGLNQYLLNSYKETAESFDFADYVVNAKVENFDTLTDEQKVQEFQNAIQKGLATGLENLANEKINNADLTLTNEQSACCIKTATAISLANNEYPNVIQNIQDMIKKINKNKSLKKCMAYDLEQLNNDLAQAKQNFEDMKNIQKVISKICDLYGIAHTLK